MSLPQNGSRIGLAAICAMWFWLASFAVQKDGRHEGATLPCCRVFRIDQDIANTGKANSQACELPDEDWFIDRLHDHGIRTEIAPEQCRSAHLVCLVKAEPGILYSETSGISQEAQILHKFFRHAGDAYTFRILEVWPLHGGAQQINWQRKTPKATISRAAPSCGWSYPHLDIASVSVVRLGSEVPVFARDVIGPLPQEAPLLYIPQPVAGLILQGAWSTTMALARWSSFKRKHGIVDFRKPLEWPGQQDLHTLFQQGRATDLGPQVVDLDQQLLRKWACQLRQWAPRILGQNGEGDRDNLANMISQMEGLASSFEGAVCDAQDDPTVKLIQTLRLAFDLRDRNNLKRVIKRAVDVLVPGSVKDMLLQRLKTFGGRFGRVFSKSKISRSQFILDVAIMVHRRGELQTQPSIHIWLADASPQLGRDFLCIRSVSIPVVSLERAHDLFMQIARLEMKKEVRPSSDEADEADEAPNVDDDDEVDRSALAQELHRIVTHRVMPPAGLGNRVSSLLHKVASFCHSVFLECGSLAALVLMLSRTFAFVADMGTDIGLSDFMARAAISVLPPWLAESQDPNDGMGWVYI